MCSILRGGGCGVDRDTSEGSYLSAGLGKQLCAPAEPGAGIFSQTAVPRPGAVYQGFWWADCFAWLNVMKANQLYYAGFVLVENQHICEKDKDGFEIEFQLLVNCMWLALMTCDPWSETADRIHLNGFTVFKSAGFFCICCTFTPNAAAVFLSRTPLCTAVVLITF